MSPPKITDSELKDAFLGAIKKMAVDVDLDCPFCGRPIGFSEETGVAIHLQPPCPEYVSSEDSLAFVKKVTQELKRKGNAS